MSDYAMDLWASDNKCTLCCRARKTGNKKYLFFCRVVNIQNNGGNFLKYLGKSGFKFTLQHFILTEWNKSYSHHQEIFDVKDTFTVSFPQSFLLWLFLLKYALPVLLIFLIHGPDTH